MLNQNKTKLKILGKTTQEKFHKTRTRKNPQKILVPGFMMKLHINKADTLINIVLRDNKTATPLRMELQ